MDDLTLLDDAWLIWSDETGVDMDQAFVDGSTPQQWCEAGIFPGDHELFIVHGYCPQDVQRHGADGIFATEMIQSPSFCLWPRVWFAHLLLWILRGLRPSSALLPLLLKSGRYILSV